MREWHNALYRPWRFLKRSIKNAPSEYIQLPTMDESSSDEAASTSGSETEVLWSRVQPYKPPTRATPRDKTQELVARRSVQLAAKGAPSWKIKNPVSGFSSKTAHLFAGNNRFALLDPEHPDAQKAITAGRAAYDMVEMGTQVENDCSSCGSLTTESCFCEVLEEIKYGTSADVDVDAEMADISRIVQELKESYPGADAALSVIDAKAQCITLMASSYMDAGRTLAIKHTMAVRTARKKRTRFALPTEDAATMTEGLAEKHPTKTQFRPTGKGALWSYGTPEDNVFTAEIMDTVPPCPHDHPRRLHIEKTLLGRLREHAAFVPRSPSLLLNLKYRASRMLADFDTSNMTTEQITDLIVSTAGVAMIPSPAEDAVRRMFTDEHVQTSISVATTFAKELKAAHEGDLFSNIARCLRKTYNRSMCAAIFGSWGCELERYNYFD